MKRFPAKRVSSFPDLPVWRFHAFGHNVILLQSGTGVSKAAKATTEAIALGAEIIISAGFCGALTAEVEVGEVLLAEKLYNYSAGAISAEIIPDQELIVLIGTQLKKGLFITTAEIVEKAHLYPLLPDPAAITMIEMESSAVAAACHTNGIRFIAIRSVSDRADQDPGRLFQQICDNEFNVRMAKVVLSLIRTPALLAEYVKLYRNTALAGKTLSEAIAFALERI